MEKVTLFTSSSNTFKWIKSKLLYVVYILRKNQNKVCMSGVTYPQNDFVYSYGTFFGNIRVVVLLCVLSVHLFTSLQKHS